MSRWCFFAIAAVPLLLGSLGPRADSRLTAWTTHGLEKIRPYSAPPADAPRSVGISAARNEFEPFQIVLRAEGGNVDKVDVDFTDLHGPHAAIPKKNITVYLERYLNLSTPSSVTGEPGEWPDPLIPRVDMYTHERRSAFPFELVRGRNQPLWIDVYVPQSTPAGSYRGEASILIDGRRSLKIPIELRVWNFDLPSTSSLRTSFGFSSIPAARQHYGRYTDDRDVANLTSMYEKAALLHRISLDGSTGVHPQTRVVNGAVQVQWSRYDQDIGPFLDGTVFSSDDPLPGAKMTSVDVHTPAMLTTQEQKIQFWRETASHFRSKGWFSRLFNYLSDEPGRNQSAELIARGKLVHRADPELKNLVTAALHPEWSDVVDIWTPIVNCFDPMPSRRENCSPAVSRAQYQAELSTGKELWWYQSCMSHGCNITGGEYFRHWPGYMIDDAPVRNRIMEWLTWKYRIQGELYFNTNEAYIRKPNPWKDVYLFGGNGDGTLFYPGRPDVIGGRKHIPIESIRLKLIREGLEDYEYLVRLEKLRGVRAASTIVETFVRAAYDFDQDPQKLYAAREAIAREIEGGEGINEN